MKQHSPLLYLAITLLLLFKLCKTVSNPLPTIKQYLDAQNSARTNPKEFGAFITTEYKDKVPAGSQVHSVWRLSFNEACPAVFDEAINFLNAATPIGALEVDLGMTYASWKHAKWMVDGNGGALSHTGAGGSTFSQRLQEFTSGSIGYGGENILWTSSGYVTGKIMVAQYVIDDGVSSRGHRSNVFQSSYKKDTKIYYLLYYDSVKSRYYQVTTFASVYNCDKCGQITCEMQKECGWSQYLADAGLADPCKVAVSSSNAQSGPAVSTPSGTTPSTPLVTNSSITGNTSTPATQKSGQLLLQTILSLWLGWLLAGSSL